jgi:peptidoglycan/xylan/chitin deacetylase (PgdA/CDA1 family)
LDVAAKMRYGVVRRLAFLLGGFLILTAEAFAQVTFSALDLSVQDKLLFQATSQSPDFGPFEALFLADLKAKALRQLTVFPEEVLLLQQKQVVQIQNRYGVFRSDSGFRAFSPIPLFPSFVSGGQIQSGKIAPMQTSPDGRYLLYLRQRSPAYGDLTLLDISREQETVISNRVEVSLAGLPAIWSPDSSYVVYSKGAALYYFSLAQLQQGRVLAEGLRALGDGRMANVRWSASGLLYYLAGSILYRINPGELFTRALYAGFLSIGTPQGRIPFAFDSNFDSFWVSPDGMHLLLNKGGRNVFLYETSVGDFHGSGDPTSLPYLYLPRDTTVRKLLWSSANTVTLLCSTRNGGKIGSIIFRLAPDPGGKLSHFEQLPDSDALDMVLSPDERHVAFMRSGEVAWKDYASWKDEGRAAHPSPLHVIWLNDNELLIAGAWYTEKRAIDTGISTLVSLSQVDRAGYRQDGTTVIAAVGDKPYTFDEKTGFWRPAAAFAPRSGSLISDSTRVYLETSKRGSYQNLIMARDIKGFGTSSVVPAESAGYEAFPAEDQTIDFANFTHGSRLRRREVSLVFNAVDSAEGLTDILNTLSGFRLRVTFFVNGEFIRRYPDAVREIADSGHEVGSLFTTYFNMTDARFKVDEGFVKAGLAKNEDDYYGAAAKDLSLLWHAPYYIVNSDIIRAGAVMNYAYIGRDLDTFDWVSAGGANQGMGIYSPAAALVDRLIAEKKPGSIIPILVGPPPGGGRGDYLFQSLDLIVNELIKLGYSVVPVSSLMEHAR